VIRKGNGGQRKRKSADYKSEKVLVGREVSLLTGAVPPPPTHESADRLLKKARDGGVPGGMEDGRDQRRTRETGMKTQP
jgi:hypothetical protein